MAQNVAEGVTLRQFEDFIANRPSDTFSEKDFVNHNTCRKYSAYTSLGVVGAKISDQIEELRQVEALNHIQGTQGVTMLDKQVTISLSLPSHSRYNHEE
jgi:hypothetical protein